MTWLKDKHDIGITNVGTGGSGTDLIGMMLVKKDNAPVWRVFDGKHIVEQFATGTPDPAYTDPEEELPLGQSDWRAGFGREIFDSADVRRYFSSIGMDLRFRDMAIAGPVPATVTKPTTTKAGFLDLEFDDWTDASNLANWTKNGTSLAQDSANEYSGTYSAQLGTNGDYIYQDTYNWTTDFQSVEFTFTCWVKTSTASKHRIGIDDGIDTTYSSYHTGGGTYEQLSVVKTLAANATRLRIICNVNNAAAGVGYFDLGAVTGTPNIAAGNLGLTTSFAEFNDDLYCAMGKVLAKLNGTGTAFTTVWEFPATITDLEPFTDDRLYIALGLSDEYWYMSTTEVCAEFYGAVTNFKFFKTVHSATPVLWGNDTVNKIRSNTNPINEGAAWSGQTTVSSSYYDITSLITKSGALYIPKEDMVYYLDSSGAVQNDLAPELASLAASTSGKNAKVYKNFVYTHAGVQGLLETDGTTNTFLNPASFMTNLTDFAGQIFALAYDEEYLFCILDNSTKIEILAGRRETIDGSTSWAWHPIAEITLTGCETAFVSSVYQKRLWISSTTASENIYYIPLPTGYGDVVNDANRKFQTGSYFITPYLHGNFRITNKAFIKLTMTLGHAYDADIYFSASYEKIGDTSWTSIGNFIGTSSNRIASAYIPADASSNNPISSMMRFKITAVTDDTAKTPILVNYTVSAVLYPTIRTLYFATIRASEEIICKNGTRDKNMYDTIITTLDNARTATWPVTIRDIDGTSRTVKFLPLPKSIDRYTVIRDEKGREQERHYNVLMQQVDLS